MALSFTFLINFIILIYGCINIPILGFSWSLKVCCFILHPHMQRSRDPCSLVQLEFFQADSKFSPNSMSENPEIIDKVHVINTDYRMFT
jgi:hypothetical protein